MRQWALSHKKPGSAMPAKESAAALLVEAACRAVWAAAAASVMPDARPLTAADLDKLCEFVGSLARRTAAPVWRTAAPVWRTAAPVRRTAAPVWRTAAPVWRTAAPCGAAAPRAPIGGGWIG